MVCDELKGFNVCETYCKFFEDSLCTLQTNGAKKQVTTTRNDSTWLPNKRLLLLKIGWLLMTIDF